MSSGDLAALIQGANAYEELLVPALFEEWTGRMIEAAQIRSGHRVLDVACGTGVLARAAGARATRAGSVTGIDPGLGMLAVARRLAPDIAWREGAAEALPFPDESFDAVASQFGLMFFADRLRAVREMIRVVRSGGRIAVAVWDSLENIPAYAAEVTLVQRIAGDRPADALRAPFVLGDRNELTALFAEAGAPWVSVTTHHGMGRFPTLRSMMEADIFGWLPLMGAPLAEDQVQRVLKEAHEVFGCYVGGDGKMVFHISAHIAAGTKP